MGPLFSVFQKIFCKVDNISSTIQAQISWVPLAQDLSQGCIKAPAIASFLQGSTGVKSASKFIAISRPQKICFQSTDMAVSEPQSLMASD